MARSRHISVLVISLAGLWLLLPFAARAQIGFKDCTTDADCDDGLFCNGVERCFLNTCELGGNPCPGQLCDEDTNTCVDCLTGCAEAAPCLVAAQTASGSWGTDATAMLDTTVVLDTLQLLGEKGTSFSHGIDFLGSTDAANHDYLARQIASLAAAGRDASGPLGTLLDGQNAEVTDPAATNYPDGGWGAAPHFGTDVLTTALALDALQLTTPSPGLSVVGAVVQAGTPNIHQFTLPAGASGLTLLIRAVTGTVRLFIDTPASGTVFTDLTNISSPVPLSGFPVEPGTYVLHVQSQSGAPNTYSFEARFQVGTVDVARTTRALSYLGFAQNGDGSWGIHGGEAGHLVITTEALRALEAYGQAFAPQSVINSGLDWLQARQNADGGFGSGGSTVGETALSILALLGGGRTSTAILDPARSYLLAQQGGNGCWNDPYSTGLALRALAQSVVNGAVTLQGRPAKPNPSWSIPLTVTVTPAGQVNPVLQFATNTDDRGRFTVSGILPGTYDVRVKGMQTLQNKLTVALALGANTIDAGTLREGDANNDNFVTLTDFSVLATTFGKCQGTAGYDARADFNQSSCVTLQDFSLLATDFGKAGDP